MNTRGGQHRANFSNGNSGEDAAGMMGVMRAMIEAQQHQNEAQQQQNALLREALLAAQQTSTAAQVTATVAIERMTTPKE